MVAPQQYFDPYPWQKIKLPKTVKDDAQDIPKAGLAGTRSETNSIGKYPDNQKRMWTGYYASVAFMDAQVGRILDELDRLGFARVRGGFHQRPWLSPWRARLLAEIQPARGSYSRATDHRCSATRPAVPERWPN